MGLTEALDLRMKFPHPIRINDDRITLKHPYRDIHQPAFTSAGLACQNNDPGDAPVN